MQQKITQNHGYQRIDISVQHHNTHRQYAQRIHVSRVSKNGSEEDKVENGKNKVTVLKIKMGVIIEKRTTTKKKNTPEKNLKPRIEHGIDKIRFSLAQHAAPSPSRCGNECCQHP